MIYTGVNSIGYVTTTFPLPGRGGNFHDCMRFNIWSSKDGSLTVVETMRAFVTSPFSVIVSSITITPFKVGLFLRAFLYIKSIEPLCTLTTSIIDFVLLPVFWISG